MHNYLGVLRLNWEDCGADMSCCCFGASGKRKSGGSNSHQDRQDGEGNLTAQTKSFSYNELRTATNDFHQSKKIGRGGFGTVYKGTLKNGKLVAVKTLSAASKQGVREFMAEIEAIANVRHPNLVQLIGCCVHGSHRILVYDYLENGSLDRALLGSMKTIMLVWDIRSAICMGVARGIAYLHEELVPHIVHRDIKASNVLLDQDFTPKIGDFGLAKLFPDNITHISTRIAGTTGYLAPEYALGGRLTLKADVYSFGVLVLEVISGRSSSSMAWGGVQKLLLEWAWQLYEEGTLLDLVDPELEEYPKEVVLRYVKVALFCTQANASRRPLMSQVIEMLSRDIRLNEKELTPPGFFQSSEGLSSAQSKEKSSGSYGSHQLTSVPSTITQVAAR